MTGIQAPLRKSPASSRILVAPTSPARITFVLLVPRSPAPESTFRDARVRPAGEDWGAGRRERVPPAGAPRPRARRARVAAWLSRGPRRQSGREGGGPRRRAWERGPFAGRRAPHRRAAGDPRLP